MNLPPEIPPEVMPPPPRLCPWDRGEAIASLQEVLCGHGYQLTIDGDFGWATESAVRSFQRRHKLRIDGIVDTVTWKHLTDTLKPGCRALHRGDFGADVRELQGLLQIYGYPLSRSGYFDTATQEAVERFQSVHHLMPDGIVTEKTWTMLRDGKPFNRPTPKTNWLLNHGRWSR